PFSFADFAFSINVLYACHSRKYACGYQP
ncbi:hypothetical protein D030_1901B, partial [Vibrio parahaemolyticus AQ3810]